MLVVIEGFRAMFRRLWEWFRKRRTSQQTTDHGQRTMPEKVVIIGSGPAGWTAAIYAARANLAPVVFEGDPTYEKNRLQGTAPLGQLNLTTEVENFPSWPAGDLTEYLDRAIPESRRVIMPPHSRHGVSGPELMELMRQQAANFGTRIVSKDVTTVDLSRRPFRLTACNRGGDDAVIDGTSEVIEAHALIIATGARANYLGLPSEDKFKNRGVSACAVCDGALPRFRNKPLVVVGGGDSAVEEATYLTKFARPVYMVLRRDAFRASKIMVERALANRRIDLKYNRVVDEVLGDDKQGVTAVRLASTKGEAPETVEATGLFLAIGHTPNTDFLGGQLELTDKGYIRWTTPQRTYTSVEGVFAAGDVADDYYRQAVTAAGTGCMAALDAERWLAGQGHH
jgi:thioredoxin reductase (NADPH)